MLILVIIACGNSDKKEKKSSQKETALVHKKFGEKEAQNDSLGVELDVANFENWTDLVNRTEKIVCHDSLPKITFRTNTEIKTIYFSNTCLDKDSPRFIKLKNVIAINNNRISKNNQNDIPLDSLESILRKDIENNGKNSQLCESSEKLRICIQYSDDKKQFKNLNDILKQLTTSYYNITNQTNLKILLIDQNYFRLPMRPKK